MRQIQIFTPAGFEARLVLFLNKGLNGPVSCSLAVCMTLTFIKVALACRSHFLLPDLYKTYLCADEIETSTSSQGKPQAFELLKIGSGVQIPAPLGPKWYSNEPYHIFGFVCQMPLLKNNRPRFLSSVTKLARYVEISI